jgi:hypothetical protein
MTTYEYGQPGSAAASRRRWLHERLTAMSAADELPTTISSLYYDGVGAGRWPSDDEAKAAGRKRLPRQDVSDDVQWLIEQGYVDADAVVDISRRVVSYEAPWNIHGGTYSYAEHVRLSPWYPNPIPLVIVESRSLASALDPVIDRYCATLAPLSGQSGRTYLRRDVTTYVEFATSIAYFGDWNPPGLHIENNVKAKLSQYAPEWDGTWDMLAVTDDDAADGDWPRKRKRDRRYRPPRPYDSIEAEALGTTELRRRLTEWLDELLPNGFTWTAHEAQTEAERAAVLRLLDADGDGGQ